MSRTNFDALHSLFPQFSLKSDLYGKQGTNLGQLYESLQNPLDLEMFLKYNGNTSAIS